MTLRFYYGSRISENMTTTPEGYLICLNVPIARTGAQQYLRSELGLTDGDTNAIIDVLRADDEVFDPATLASFEGKPVTDDHPPVSVTTENIVAYDCGHAQNIRRGTGDESDLLIADLFITSPRLIAEIQQQGRREISCGYDCEYVQDDEGRIFQRSIRGNHIAVVPAGRAGRRVAIKDSQESEPITTYEERGKKTMANSKKNQSLVARLFSRAVKDMEPDEVADCIDEMTSSDEAAPAATPAPAADETPASQDNPIGALLDAVTGLGQKIDALCAAVAPKDVAPAPAADPLDNLADEIGATETPADQEASETIPADELPDSTADEDGPIAAASTLPENPIPGADRAIAIAAINAVKPIIAALPENQRRAASDRAAAEIRKLIGKDSKPKSNSYAGINTVMRQAAKAKDSKAKADDGTLGQKIMESRNPHYKKS